MQLSENEQDKQTLLCFSAFLKRHVRTVICGLGKQLMLPVRERKQTGPLKLVTLSMQPHLAG